LIDVAAQVDDRADPRRLYRGHFTEEGYALVAEITRARLAELRGR